MMSRTATDLIRPSTLGGGGERLRVGFIPLVDCAPLVVARDKGFARDEGLELDLVREASWANIRDRVVLGHFDAAHMLAPMAIAARLGLGHLVSPVVAPFVMNHGGNSIALTLALHREAGEGAWGRFDDPAASGRALAGVVAARAAAGREPLTLAIVHPFSCHNYQIRYWLAAAGVDPDRDVRLVVVPPPYMVDAMAAGVVDGACVGAPWPGLAVDAGVGRIAVTTHAIWPMAPEKVLGLRETLIERRPETVHGLIRALERACAWCETPENHEELARLLARPEIVGVEASVVLRTLTGRLLPERDAAPTLVPGFIGFHGATPSGSINRPRVADGLWLAAQMVWWGQTRDTEAALTAARRAFAPEVFDRALAPEIFDRAPDETPATVDTGFVVPFDGARFDAADPAAWIAGRVAAGGGSISGRAAAGGGSIAD